MLAASCEQIFEVRVVSVGVGPAASEPKSRVDSLGRNENVIWTLVFTKMFTSAQKWGDDNINSPMHRMKKTHPFYLGESTIRKCHARGAAI
jgi:hypothetical protein